MPGQRRNFAVVLAPLAIAGCATLLGDDPYYAVQDGSISDATTQEGSVSGGKKDAALDAGEGGVADAAVQVPRPVSPLSTSRVTSQTPTFRWVLPLGVPDATVDLCSDRACVMKIMSAHVTGTSYTPKNALTIGVTFWRLHPGTSTTVTSPTWQLSVGARSAAVDGGVAGDTSWGTTFDVNGDGYADLAIGASGVSNQPGGVYVYLGGVNGIGTAPTTTLTGPGGMNGQFGVSVASAGDVNGDGYADLVVGAADVSSLAGRAYLYLGGVNGVATTPAATLVSPVHSGGFFGTSVASAGDVNGDGYADVIVGEPGSTSTPASTYIYLGSASGLSTAPSITLPSPVMGAYFGSSVASAGDVNGDGYADVIVGAGGASNGLGHAYLYFGSAKGPAAKPTTILSGPNAGALFGDSVGGAGDVNGDGYADVVVGAPNAASIGSAYVYLGSASGLVTVAATTLNDPDGVSNDGFGDSIAGAGDMDGDGYDDVIVGASGASDGAGDAYLYLGSATGLGMTPAITLADPGNSTNDLFGASVASAGDVNDDGYGDLVVGSNGALNMGNAYVYLGGAVALPTQPTTVLSSGDGGTGSFGVSVFGAGD